MRNLRNCLENPNVICGLGLVESHRLLAKLENLSSIECPLKLSIVAHIACREAIKGAIVRYRRCAAIYKGRITDSYP